MTTRDLAGVGIKSVERYRLQWRSGHSKWATKVVFEDGEEIRFTNLLSKREAARNALFQRALAAGATPGDADSAARFLLSRVAA